MIIDKKTTIRCCNLCGLPLPNELWHLNLDENIFSPMDAKAKVDFTPEQLIIIGIALENWLVNDTCISLNGKYGKPFIDKKLNSKTFLERLTEASKISA